MDTSRVLYYACRDEKGILLTLPTELLVYIVSFLTTRDKAKLQYVSRRLQSVIETSSLWKMPFVWPYYHIGDEDSVNNVLKMCGQHMKLVSTYFKAAQRELYKYDKQWSEELNTGTSKLLGMLKNCGNVTQLSLRLLSINYDHAVQLKEVLQHMRYLQRLDVQWDNDIKQLLVAFNHGVYLKELTIRTDLVRDSDQHHGFSWVRYWMSNGFVPQNINIVTGKCFGFSQALTSCYVGLNRFQSPAGCTGHVKVYSMTNIPLNLYTVLPEFQLDFGQTTTPLFANPISIELEDFGVEDSTLLVTDGETKDGVVIQKAAIISRSNLFMSQGSCGRIPAIHLESVTELDFSRCDDCKHLKHLAIACPNLQRLNLQGSKTWLRNLQGLQAIAASCWNLQGLNLMNIAIIDVEDQFILWKTLSDMKLTHLSIEWCALLPPLNADIQQFISLFQKCKHLQALESGCNCNNCISKSFDKRLLILSHFPSLTQCRIMHLLPGVNTLLQEIIIGCKHLKCLYYLNDRSAEPLTEVNYCNLQQLYIESFHTDLPDSFMSSISTHGGLVHVVLCVRSVNSEGIAVLVGSSPNLIMFHTVVHAIFDGKGIPLSFEKFKTSLKKRFSHRQLFTSGSYITFKVYHMFKRFDDSIIQEHQHNTDLHSLWNCPLQTHVNILEDEDVTFPPI